MEARCAGLKLEIEELNIAKDMLATRYNEKLQSLLYIVTSLMIEKRKELLWPRRNIPRR